MALLRTCFVIACVLLAQPALAAERVDYLRDIKPLLVNRCYACHGALQQKGSLRLDTVAFMKQGGDNGPAIRVGKSGESRLLHHVTGKKGFRRMPPTDDGEALHAHEIAQLREWVDAGATAPANDLPEADPKDHWAFQPPNRPALPQVRSAHPRRNPIDAFLAAEHEKRGLTPAPPADKRLLLRRVYLDLIGLPPTPEEQQAFLTDRSPDAYEKVVDRLLSSPRHGERWGRHWMDVWRYSDWWGLGAEVRNSQKHIWHWRDWILESISADKGYDAMVREMLAADELHPTDSDRLRATGFLVRSYFKFNRNTWLEDVVEHTSKAFLGLTMNCAKCHDHKYDPFSQTDFYRFRAFFEPYQIRTDMVRGETDYEKNGVPRVFDCNLDTPTYLFVRGDERQPRKNKSISPALPALLGGKLAVRPVELPAESHQPGLRPHVLDNYLTAAEARIAAARRAVEKHQLLLTQTQKSVPVQKIAIPGKSAQVLVRENFQKANAERWEQKSGEWEYKDGKLFQRQDGLNRAAFRLKTAVPTDFQASVKFTPLGGQMWKSVGLSFDVAEGRDFLAYLTAYTGGPRFQLAYKNGGDYTYPPEASIPMSVKVGQTQELQLRVRDRIVNVAVNGKHILAYQLPAARKGGAIELVAFDARVEFQSFELSTLPTDAELVAPGGGSGMETRMTQAQASVALMAAEKALAAALLQPELWKARADADRARANKRTEAKDLARQATLLERKASLADAEELVAKLEAELAFGGVKGASEKKLPPARAAVAAARKALDAPGETYTSLRGARKTLESNLESEASRSRPFPTTSTGRRSALAGWLTASENPLTARVAVNHLWTRHFGKPLVPTIFDFGRKGQPPTHPELLDWLATEFVESGWSMRHIHRLMVTSSAYQRSSADSAVVRNRPIDPENRFYWRMNSTRMEAQVVRDSLLHLTGGLDAVVGGPSVPVGAETGRRSLYFVHSHNDQQKFLSIFDDANVLECYRRSESIIPQQALALQNSAMALNAAEKIAARLDPTITSDDALIHSAFQTVLGCTPNAQEVAASREALSDLRQAGIPIGRVRTTLIHALLNHNDFITVR